MAYTLREALKHRNVKDVRILVREASFYLESLQTEIRIRLYIRPEDEQTLYYETSHHLKTPLHRDRVASDRNYGASEAEAFHAAMTSLTDPYDDAVMSGHRPSEDWLVPNRFF